jgi:hypothetical protein
MHNAKGMKKPAFELNKRKQLLTSRKGPMWLSMPKKDILSTDSSKTHASGKLHPKLIGYDIGF